MENLIAILEENQISYLENEPLKNWCTFRIGGPANLFIEPKSNEEISIVIKETNLSEIPYLVLGRGSNVLFSDKGFDGVIIHLGKNLAHMSQLDENTIKCESGALLTEMCQYSQTLGLAGMEPLYGIPGSVGGAVYMNAGAYGGEVKDVAISAEYIDANGDIGTLKGSAMDLAYRHSAFTDSDKIITSLTVRLKSGDKAEIQKAMDDYMNRRRTKQPLDMPSAGSTFKRPEGNYASALIDQTGLKGKRVGDAMVSEKHAGFVVNVGNATAEDVLGLIDFVHDHVKKETGYILEPEIKLIGRL